VPRSSNEAIEGSAGETFAAEEFGPVLEREVRRHDQAIPLKTHVVVETGQFKKRMNVNTSRIAPIKRLRSRSEVKF
jgi:hypothetical protein